MDTSFAYAGGRAGTHVPAVRRLSFDDLQGCLRAGLADFLAMPSHLVFVGLIYPVLGIVLASFAFGYDVLPLLFPIASGFALVGPVAGIGLYELSRRREAGQEPKWRDAFQVLRSPAIGSILAMGGLLVAIFLAWLASADALFGLLMGTDRSESYPDLIRTVLSTERGWALILLGNAIGFAFATLVLTVSVIAFPMLLDRNCGVATAVETSRRVVLANPAPMAGWGAIVAALVALGSLPVFVGLAVVMPILGHATWHLYRRAVAG